MKRICQRCGSEFDRYIRKSHLAKGKGKFCSQQCFWKTNGENHRDEKSPSWKEEMTYGSLHDWLGKKFGSANKCENKECKGISKTFQWSLLKGKRYEKKRENFWQLCRSCHYKYDGAKIGGWFKGKKLPMEMRKKISMSLKGNQNARKL